MHSSNSETPPPTLFQVHTKESMATAEQVFPYIAFSQTFHIVVTLQNIILTFSFHMKGFFLNCFMEILTLMETTQNKPRKNFSCYLNQRSLSFQYTAKEAEVVS